MQLVEQLRDDDVFYPETDGKPMAETDFQRKPLMHLVDVMDLFFKPIEDVYVSGNILVYYEEGNPRKVFSPDVMVACEVPKKERPIYKVWEEGKAPDVIVEISSKSTYHTDQFDKARLYAKLGVSEYFQYDPTGECQDKRLTGRRLVKGNWMEIKPFKLPGVQYSLACWELDIAFCLTNDNDIRVYVPDQNRFLMSLEETDDELSATREKVQAERAKAEEERVRADEERTNTEAARARAEKERARADGERVRAETAEKELADMKRRMREMEERFRQS